MPQLEGEDGLATACPHHELWRVAQATQAMPHAQMQRTRIKAATSSIARVRILQRALLSTEPSAAQACRNTATTSL